MKKGHKRAVGGDDSAAGWGGAGHDAAKMFGFVLGHDFHLEFTKDAITRQNRTQEI